MRTCLFLISLLSAGLLPQASGAKPPNILVILVDDMGYGDLTAYNPESKIPTPHLDKLAPFHHVAQHFPRRIIDAIVTPQVARVMIGDFNFPGEAQLVG